MTDPDRTQTSADVPPPDPLSDGPVPPALATWLARHVPEGGKVTRLARMTGGQSNPTWALTGDGVDLILRRRPLGPVLPSAHAVDREFRILRALAPTEIPVPVVHALCDDPAIAGAMFYVMERVPGRILWDPRLPDWPATARGALFADLVDVLARLHRLDPVALDIADFGRAGRFFARAVARWTRQYRATETGPIPAMDRLIGWLPEHLPAEGPARIVHGDFRLDNLVIDPDRPRVAAVLDWELSTLGDPRADIAHLMTSWHVSPDLFRGLGGCDLAATGIPDEAECVARWSAGTGIDPRPDWPFLMAFSLFRLAAIFQGIARRAEDGSAADPAAAALGRKARPMAELAVDWLT